MAELVTISSTILFKLSEFFSIASIFSNKFQEGRDYFIRLIVWEMMVFSSRKNILPLKE